MGVKLQLKLFLKFPRPEKLKNVLQGSNLPSFFSKKPQIQTIKFLPNVSPKVRRSSIITSYNC